MGSLITVMIDFKQEDYRQQNQISLAHHCKTFRFFLLIRRMAMSDIGDDDCYDDDNDEQNDGDVFLFFSLYSASLRSPTNY